MILAEDLAIMDWNSQKRWEREEGRKEGREEGRKEGRKEGQDEVVELYKWLFENGRAEDVQKATMDDEFRNKLFERYKS